MWRNETLMLFVEIISRWFLALVIVLVVGFFALGYHIVYAPTPDQLYGCTVAQQAPNGECQ